MSATLANPKRGEIWWVELEPVRGSEQAKKRPVVVISHANYGRPTVRLGVPIMEHKTVHGFGAWYIKIEPDADNGLKKTSSADASQIRALDVVRFDNRIGHVTLAQLSAIVAGVKMGIEELTMKQRSLVPTDALARAVEFDDDMMHVALTDGRVVSVPLVWFPRLTAATAEQLALCQIGAGGRGLHWDELDEDLSVSGLMAGADWRNA